MTTRITRRQLLGGAAATAAGLYLLPGCSSAPKIPPRRAIAPGEKLRLGLIGVGNRGYDNLKEVASEHIVAICDVDDEYLATAAKELPGAAQYWDYRIMIGSNQEKLDAVVISTPDHHHALAAVLALQAGLDVYCEKPLSHDLSEARAVRELAKKTGAVTQMGIQIHERDNYRRAVELVKAGVLGEIREAHVFVNGTNWSASGIPAKEETPKKLHYDKWLGPVSKRPYSSAYHPAGWRSYWLFGNGTMGDMACHYMDLAFWALDLRAPTSAEAQGPPLDPYACPDGLEVRYEFPARGAAPPVRLTWYDGKRRPPILAKLGLDSWRNGVLFIGEKGHLIANYDTHELGPKDRWEGFQPPAPTIAKSIGHHREWIEACKTRGATTCGFDYTGPLTETVLLGTVAYRMGRKLEWDADAGVITNAPDAAVLVSQPRVRGWELFL